MAWKIAMDAVPAKGGDGASLGWMRFAGDYSDDVVDGRHDPNKPPPAGFSSWDEVVAHNNAVIAEASRRQDVLESQGFHYNPSDGTWVGPDGRTTTLFADDSGPEGGVDYHWDSEGTEQPGMEQPGMEEPGMETPGAERPGYAYV